MRGIAFSPDGKFLLTTSARTKTDQGAAVWSIAQGDRVRTLQAGA